MYVIDLRECRERFATYISESETRIVPHTNNHIHQNSNRKKNHYRVDGLLKTQNLIKNKTDTQFVVIV